jgi:serine/threonine protein kinase
VTNSTHRQALSSDPLVGKILDHRYRVLHRIGKGGMGCVYAAEHLLIRRKVAIKTLLGSLSGRPEALERFHREAIAAAAIGDEHVVSVTDMGQLDSGDYYLVLEYLEGCDLAWLIASEGSLSVSRSLHIALQLCDALVAVHDKGIVHRDLKPENVFLVDRKGMRDFVKVLDFGICKIQEGSPDQRKLTETGVALGTPHYMAPEQVEARGNIDLRADLYAVTAILYFTLTGDPPFDASTLPQLFLRICYDAPPALHMRRADASEALERLVARGLAKRPEARFANAAELRAALLEVDPAVRQGRDQPVTSTPSHRACPGAAERVSAYSATIPNQKRLEEPSSPRPLARRRLSGVRARLVASAALLCAVVTFSTRLFYARPDTRNQETDRALAPDARFVDTRREPDAAVTPTPPEPPPVTGRAAPPESSVHAQSPPLRATAKSRSRHSPEIPSARSSNATNPLLDAAPADAPPVAIQELARPAPAPPIAAEPSRHLPPERDIIRILEHPDRTAP